MTKFENSTVSKLLFYYLLLICLSQITNVLGIVTSKNRRLSRRSLEAEVINSTTINLSWARSEEGALRLGSDENSPACPVQRYLIKLKENGAGKIKTWKVEAEKVSVTLHGLQPSTDYFIRVVTVICDGTGRPSRWVRVRTSKETSSYHINNFESLIETSPPGQPVSVTSVGHSDSAIVTWNPPEGGVLVRGYVVGYGEGVPDVNWQYLEAHRRNVTIRNLKKSTQYVISLRAFNNAGKGPVVYDLAFTKDSKDDQPVRSHAPIKLQSRVLSPTTIWLQWFDPALDEQQTIADSRYYSVAYRVLPDGRNMSVVVRDLHVALYQLEPATRYEFKVRAVIDSKPGAYSETVVNRTLETAPSSSPRQVKVEKLYDDTSKLLITWKTPKHANGNITEYIILYTWIEDWLEEPDRWQSMTVPGHAREAVLSNININESYYFRLQARNSHGYGPKSDIIRLSPNSKSATTELPESRKLPDINSPQRKTTQSGQTLNNGEDDYEFNYLHERHIETDTRQLNSRDGRTKELPSVDDSIQRGADPQDLSGRDSGKAKREPTVDHQEGRRDLIAESIVHPNQDDTATYQEFLARTQWRSNHSEYRNELSGDNDTNMEPSPKNRTEAPLKEINVLSSRTSMYTAQTYNKTRQKDARNDADQGHSAIPIQFRSIVRIRASAYITWPRLTPVVSCSLKEDDQIFYKFRYQLIDGGTFDRMDSVDREAITIQLTENVILLDDLRVGARYKYQVQYIIGQDMKELDWSQEEILHIV